MNQHVTFYRGLGAALAMQLCLLTAAPPAHAQQPGSQQAAAAQPAAQLVLQTRAQWAGEDIPAASYRISSARTEPTGLLYAYPQQLQAGIPVYNRVVTLVFKNGALRHHAGAFVPAKAFAGQPATPTVTAAAALATALASTGLPNLESPRALSPATGAERQQTFEPAGMAHRPIEVRLVWATDKGQPRLAWNVNVDLVASPDWLNIRVDATTGQVLGEDNWTVNERAVHPAAAPARRPVAAAGPTWAPQALWHPSGAKSTQAVTSASYRVVPFPNERPDVTTPRLDTDPWLRAGAGNPVTTYGWNFDGTTNYTDTRGNNVWAYDDSLNLNMPGRFTASTGTGGSLLFNDVVDLTRTPTLGRNRRAATTNLFYWNNLLHDVMYQYGFTEAAGNFQTDNQGRGGVGSDYVRAEAQDGKDTNNANFSTPPDGTSGRMQMYLFTGITPTYTINVTAPTAVAGNYVAVESAFSTNNKLASLGPISGQLALYADAGSSPVTYQGCGTYGGTTPLTGKIAVIYRGVCGFVVKVKNAQTEGASAVIVINNAAGAPTVMGGTDNTITIPAVMISQADGATLADQIGNGVQVTLPKPSPTGPQLDGDFDSGIMAHEYGHGISNRLTAGGVNTSCLGNAEQAGEGWSDFVALMMTTDWTTTPLTDGPRARPTGTYASGQATTGSGIRRYPYSTNMSVNPLTYANVATNTEVHAIGEVWTATLWDMTWNIIQQQGRIEPNLYNSASTGGNAVALSLVMQGLKLQPCEPGFLDSRDAILAADSLLYGGRYHCAIWGAFARRGMGASAREGSSNSAADQTAAYDLPGVRLRKNSKPLVGNQFALNITATCECQTQAPVSLTDQLPTGLQYVSSTGGTLNGNTVTFAGLSFAQGQQRTFQIIAQTAVGAGCPVTLPVNDDRDGNTLGNFTPAVVTAGGGNAWTTTTTRAHGGTAAWNAGDPNALSDVTLTSAAFTPGAFSVLSFYHFFNSEARYDGGMVAVSVNNGAWLDANAYFLQNGYNNVFATGTASAKKPCFSGKSSGLDGAAAFQQSLIDLSSFSGQSIRVRFQFQSDENNPYLNDLPGWYVDDIQVQNGCGGVQQVRLLSSTNTVLGSYAQVTFLTEPLTTWTGAASTDWFTAGNWSAGVPTSALEAIIPAGMPRYPVLTTGTATARALTLNSNATLTQTDGTLDVRGTWTNNGTFAASGGTVQLGTNPGAQLVGSSATRFWNLTTTGNAVDLNTAAGLAIQRLLLTNTSLNANGNLVLLESNASGTALLASPTAGASLLGTSVTVQRYISAGPNAGAGYRHLASPTQGATFGDLATATFTPVVNAAYNTSATPGTVTPFPTIYGYDQSRLTTTTNNLGAFDKGWLSPTALGDQLTPGLGYTVSLAANQAVVFKGQPAFGDLTRTLTRNAAGTANDADAGWNLVGNPYASPYDYAQQAAADLTGLDPTIYVYTSSTQYTGVYRAILNGVGGSAVLPMGQGFFMHVASGATSGTLTFRNAQRVTTYQNPSYLRTAETRPLVQLSLKATGSTAAADDAYVYFEQGASDGYEPAFDALKLPNPTGLNLSASLAGRQLAIAGYAPLGTTQRVMPLAVGVPAPGTYTLAAAQLLNLATTPVYLRDLQTGALLDLSQQPSYQFSVTNAATLVTGRFELVFSPQQALATAPAALAQQVALYPSPAKASAFLELPASLGRQAVSASLVDALGRVVRTIALPAQGAVAHPLDLRGLASGVYALRLSTSAGTVVKRLTIE